MYTFNAVLKKSGIYCGSANLTLLTGMALIAVSAFAGGRVEVAAIQPASLEPLPTVPAARDSAQSESTITVITHQYTRIADSLPGEDFPQMSRSRGSLATVLIEARAERVRHRKDTYINTLAARDGMTRTIELVTTVPMFEFARVGFPHIETSRRKSADRYKPYRQLLKLGTSPDGQRYAVPNVRCFGYSPERTHRRAARYEPQIREFAERYKVDRHLVMAVVAQESCFRAHVVSPAGAVGLMQLMPATASWLGVKDKKNATQNLRAGIRYLGQLTRRYESQELALAAYNAGPGNVQRYDGVPPFRETREYIRQVMLNYHSYVASSQYNEKQNELL